MSSRSAWRFQAHFDRARQDQLVSLRNFTEVVGLLSDSIEAIHVRPQRGKAAELTQCLQPIFLLTVSALAFDAFFNSHVGYRASYLKHPNHGLLANLSLIESLADRLVAAARQASDPELDSINLRASLLATSCKAWVYEDEFPFQALTQDLAVRPWLKAAAQGEKKAHWGLCAPKGTHIEIKGALLDPAGHEVVPRNKVLRRMEIHEFGFS